MTVSKHEGLKRSSVDGEVQLADLGDVTLAYETFGSDRDPPAVLIMGLATEMLGWPDAFCSDLADRGHALRHGLRYVGLLDALAPA